MVYFGLFIVSQECKLVKCNYARKICWRSFEIVVASFGCVLLSHLFIRYTTNIMMKIALCG